MAKQRNSRFCSQRCYKAWWKRHRPEKPRPMKKPKHRAYPDRPYTEDTPYWCWKWYHEGDSLEKICEVLERSRESVLRAIAEYEREVRQCDISDRSGESGERVCADGWV